MKCVIIIPVYKTFSDLTCNELSSLKQTLKILYNYEIVLIGGHNHDLEPYQQIGTTYGAHVTVKNFSNSFFATVSGYNRLLISTDFYKTFIHFKYMLICQLDAWVFRDELKHWCLQKFDYIGAPWNGIHNYKQKSLTGVGNGGFSLRNIKNSIKLLNDLRYTNTLNFYKDLNTTNLILKFPIILYKLLSAKKKVSEFESNFSFYEDIFWSKAAKSYIAEFKSKSFIVKWLKWLFVKDSYKVAPSDIGRRFSFETYPKEMYRKNNDKLPFGCHAWEKYDPEFWKKFIPFDPVTH
jgi:hypothetical protein